MTPDQRRELRQALEWVEKTERAILAKDTETADFCVQCAGMTLAEVLDPMDWTE